MIRSTLLIFGIVSMLAASDNSRLYELYQGEKYRQACDFGVKKLRDHQRDEKFVSLYAFSCLKADKIDQLALPIVMLKRSTESRKNAAYFSAILLQKNLLINALDSHLSLDSLNLPTSDYVLSRVFDLYSANHFTLKHGVYILNDPENPKHTYRLYLRRSGSTVRLFIDEYYDTIMTKQHIYR